MFNSGKMHYEIGPITYIDVGGTIAPKYGKRKQGMDPGQARKTDRCWGRPSEIGGGFDL